MSRLAQSLYIALGASGAMVDVTSYLDLEEAFDRRWGRESEFEDTSPGEFSFTLDNMDGRFTPGNTTAATSAGYATTLTEGMVVCHQLGGSRLVRGTVQGIEPLFPGGDAAWSQVRVTCDDMLGNAARVTVDTLADAILTAATPFYFWPLDEAAGATVAAERSGNGGFALLASGTPVFGVAGPAGFDQSQVLIRTNGSTLTGSGVLETPSYAANSLGAWGFWAAIDEWSGSTATFLTVTGGANLPGKGYAPGDAFDFNVKVSSSGQVSLAAGASAPAGTYIPPFGTDVYYSVVFTHTYSAGTWTYAGTLYANGVSISTVSGVTATTIGITSIVLTGTGATGESGIRVARLSHTSAQAHEEYQGSTTVDGILNGVDEAATGVTFATLPTELADTTVSAVDTGGQSLLEIVNDVIRTEQGHVYCATTGSLSAPVEKITVRERTRPTTVTASFNAETEAQGAVDFIRDLTYLAYTVTVDGPTQSATYTDSTLSSRAGSKTASDTVLNTDAIDLLAWAQDRSVRGANTGLRCASITIDAFNTPTDRSADLLALVPGNRYQITGLPSTQLGFTTWDGWLLGVDEVHSLTEHTFTLHLAPVLPHTAVYDTDRYCADGVLTLTSNILAGATSMSVTSSGALLSTTETPYVLRITTGSTSECVTVTAVSGASSPQTATISRGATDPMTGLATTATSHTAGDLIDLADLPYYAF